MLRRKTIQVQTCGLPTLQRLGGNSFTVAVDGTLRQRPDPERSCAELIENRKRSGCRSGARWLIPLPLHSELLLIGAPSNIKTPLVLSKVATEIAENYPNFRCKVLGQVRQENELLLSSLICCLSRMSARLSGWEGTWLSNKAQDSLLSSFISSTAHPPRPLLLRARRKRSR
jgi:hypothetical protein